MDTAELLRMLAMIGIGLGLSHIAHLINKRTAEQAVPKLD